ncbi:MAG: pyruvate, water dikinase regulatory protein [Planctomycetota bacterium]
MTTTGDRRAIYVISDSTGETGAKVVQAALLQFRHEQVNLRLFGNLRDSASIADVLDKAAGDGALVVYTLVKTEHREALYNRAAEFGVQSVDLMGPLMARLGQWLEEAPMATPGLLHRMDEEYFRRIEAMEFAVKHDDGQELPGFRKADVVVVGVSRTSKTPVCAYLAQRGYRAANMPLVLGVPIPPELERVDTSRLFGLKIAPMVLRELRLARVDRMGVADRSNYADLAHIREEITYAAEVYRTHPDWTILDVTRRAVEETASDMLAIYQSRFGPLTI